MPVAEILAGIALVKSSVDFIKSNIDTVKDIGEIGDAIDKLLTGNFVCCKADDFYYYDHSGQIAVPD